MATHGILSADAPRLLEDSPIDEVDADAILSFSQLLFACTQA
jgi:hypothetical protein